MSQNTSLESIQSKFGRGDGVRFSEGVNGLHVVTLTLPSNAKASLYLHGAHLYSFITETGRELIFMSSKASITPTSNIRGGIPVAFPQFGPTPLPGLKALPQHGFARNSNDWTVIDTNSSNKEVSVTIELKDSEATKKLWPHSFQLLLKIALQSDSNNVAQLVQTLTATNMNPSAPLDFTVLLHTYFAINDVRHVTVGPLQGLKYLDKVGIVAEKEESQKMVPITGETDRVYANAPDILEIHDPGRSSISLTKEGFKDLVLWNIWAEKSMADLGDGEWQKYVCAEVGSVKEPVHLEAGASWTGRQIIKDPLHQNDSRL